MNWATRLLGKMVMNMQKGAASAMQEELKNIQDELLKGALDPQKIADFARKMGIDMSQFSGMMGKQAGFDPYTILGLDKSATDEEVKQAYRELVNQYHPDKSGTPRTKFAFQMVMAAYEFIKRERGWQ